MKMNTEKFENAAEALDLDTATDRASAEYDLVKSLMEAADYRDNAITPVDICRSGKFLFTVHLRPLSADEVRQANKKATKYGKNPKGAKYPQIEKDFNTTLLQSWLIYLATTPEDQEKIWGNPAVKSKYGLLQNFETVDALLTSGEKAALINKISEISGFDEDFDPEEHAKN